MKKIIAIFVIALLASTSLFAQKNPIKSKPFIIRGQLNNCTAKQAMLAFTDNNGQRIHEYANIDEQGKFSLVSDKVTSPVLVSLQSAAFNFMIYAAPGYDLILTADCKSQSTINQTKSIEGYGATATRYLFISDLTAPKSKKNWFELNSDDLLVYLKARKSRCDSIYHIVFSKKMAPDKYYEVFRRKVKLDIEFFNLDCITDHAGKDTTMNYQQAINFVNKNSNRVLLQNLFRKEYLLSDSYQTFMKDGYDAYLWHLRLKKNPAIDKKKYQVDFAQIIASNYKGEIKYTMLNTLLQNAVRDARSFEELTMYKKYFPFYISQLNKQAEKKEIEKLLGDKEKELFKTQVGKPAPLFTAIDNSGKSFDLADFKGKVILLDLWASWCVPCRQLTPYLKDLMNKYDSQTTLAFVSVAVNDKTENWKKAMADDKPTWLQLFDNKGIVQNSYVANSIPKLIVIDKKGNIVTFDAPMSMDELKKVLDTELSK